MSQVLIHFDSVLCMNCAFNTSLLYHYSANDRGLAEGVLVGRRLYDFGGFVVHILWLGRRPVLQRPRLEGEEENCGGEGDSNGGVHSGICYDAPPTIRRACTVDHH